MSKLGLGSPITDLRFCVGKRKRRRALKNVPMVHSKRVLNIDRAFAFDAESPITRNGQTIFEWLFQPLIHALEKLRLREFSHGLVVPSKQIPRRVEPEQPHSLETFFAQLRSENAVVGQGWARAFARCFLRQPP